MIIVLRIMSLSSETTEFLLFAKSGCLFSGMQVIVNDTTVNLVHNQTSKDPVSCNISHSKCQAWLRAEQLTFQVCDR